jgi:bile acid:Na+ symporter, BASS family
VEKIIVAVFLAAFMLQAGLGCDFNDLMTALKNRGMMVRAFLAEFIVVPIVGVIVVRLFVLDDFVAAGILLMAIAPGVPFLPMLAGAKHGGNQGLATALTVLLPAVSIVTVPITAPLVLPVNAAAHIVLARFIFNLLLLQLLPLAVGLFIRARSPENAPTLIKAFMTIAALAILVLLFAVVPRMGAAFAAVYGSRGLMATLAIIILCAAIGWLFGGSDPQYRNTMALSTVMRNFGLALLVTGQNFQGTVATPVVITYFVIQFVGANVLGAFLKRTVPATT